MNIFEVRAKVVPQETLAGTEHSFLVRAKSGAAAVKQVASKFVYMKAMVADNMRVAELMADGVKVENVKEAE